MASATTLAILSIARPVEAELGAGEGGTLATAVGDGDADGTGDSDALALGEAGVVGLV